MSIFTRIRNLFGRQDWTPRLYDVVRLTSGNMAAEWCVVDIRGDAYHLWHPRARMSAGRDEIEVIRRGALPKDEEL